MQRVKVAKPGGDTVCASRAMCCGNTAHLSPSRLACWYGHSLVLSALLWLESPWLPAAGGAGGGSQRGSLLSRDVGCLLLAPSTLLQIPSVMTCSSQSCIPMAQCQQGGTLCHIPLPQHCCHRAMHFPSHALMLPSEICFWPFMCS